MIIRKSPDELDKMRTAGRIVAGTIGLVVTALEIATDDALPGRVDRRVRNRMERALRER